MNKAIELKPRMSIEEMTEYFRENNVFDANPIIVGRFATQLGYKRVRQMTNGKYHYFYIKNTQ